MIRIACCFVFGAILASPAMSQESACVFASNQAATAQIVYTYTTSDGERSERGTGFIISPLGHLITNAHVVSPRNRDLDVKAAKVEVRVGSLLNPPVEAVVLARDDSNDLALLRLPKPSQGDWATVTIGREQAFPVGTRLLGLGFGAAGDLAIVPAGEKTANLTVVDGNVKPWWQTSLALNEGNSGGPIFGQLGTVVGVAVAKRSAAQLVTYVIPIGRAQHLLDAAQVTSSQTGQCAVFPECRHASHGTERYAIDENKSAWGSWRGGGYNRSAFCSALLAQLQAQHPASTFSFVRDDEQSREFGIRQFEYRYFCEFRRQEKPIYEMKRSIACLK